MRIVIELKKDEPAQVVLNNLYKMTPMQSSFGIILLAIVRNQPKVLNLREALSCFIEHRKDVVRRVITSYSIHYTKLYESERLSWAKFGTWSP